MKKYQINYVSFGEIKSEIFEAVSRQAAHKLAESLGYRIIKK